MEWKRSHLSRTIKTVNDRSWDRVDAHEHVEPNPELTHPSLAFYSLYCTVHDLDRYQELVQYKTDRVSAFEYSCKENVESL